MFWSLVLLRLLLYGILQPALGQDQGTLAMCSPNQRDSYPSTPLVEDCSQPSLSWMATSKIATIEYYGLEASCTNSTPDHKYILISNRYNRLGWSSFHVDDIPPTAIPSSGQECTYFGCVLDRPYGDVHYFNPVTCTGESLSPTPTTTIPLPTTTITHTTAITATAATTTITATTITATTTTLPLLSSPPMLRSEIIMATATLYSTASPVTDIMVPSDIPASVELPSEMPTTSPNSEVTAGTLWHNPRLPNGTQETLIADNRNLVVLTPVIMAAFTLVLLLFSLAGCYYCMMKHRRTDYRKRHMVYSVPQAADTQLDLDNDFDRYFCASLSRDLSPSEASIYTVFECLGKTDTGGNTEILNLCNQDKKPRPQLSTTTIDLSRFDSNQYIIGMSEGSIWNQIATAGPSGDAGETQSSAGDDCFGKEAFSAAGGDYEEEYRCSDVELESEEPEDSGSYFQVENEVGNEEPHAQDKLKHLVPESFSKQENEQGTPLELVLSKTSTIHQ